jgi:hypothetical protein
MSVAAIGSFGFAMLHWHYIGFIDPRRPIDISVRPARPIPICPLSFELVSKLAERFGVADQQVEILDGYVISHLGIFGTLHPFEAELVANGCVVMTEMFEVVQPPEAVLAYREFLDEYWECRRTDN